MTDLTLDLHDGKLNIRVAAWIEAEEHILVAIFPDGSMSLPGGRLKFTEHTLAGVQREILEETGEDLQAAKLFAIVENFFFDAQYQKHFHEFLYIYKGQINRDITHQFLTQDEETIAWLPKARLGDLYPKILHTLAPQIDDEGIQHIVHREG